MIKVPLLDLKAEYAELRDEILPALDRVCQHSASIQGEERGNPAKWVVLGVSGLVGGMMYPVSVLPGPLQVLARLIPVTYALEGMRAALLAGAGWNQLWPSIAALLIFAAILIPVSSVVFAWSLRRTKITGTLTHI